jgi:hypothetical protein
MMCRKKYEPNNLHVIDLEREGGEMTMCIFFMPSCADIHISSIEIPPTGTSGDSMTLFF